MNSHYLKLSYPCIFSKSPEDAAQNLFGLISKQDCGFDEGMENWKGIVEKMLDGNLDVQSLNFHGTDFSSEWWKKALTILVEEIKKCSAK